MARAPKILIDYRGPWGLGDLLCSEPLVRALREVHGPDAELRYRGHAGNAAYSPAWNGPEEAGFDPDGVIPISLFMHMPKEDFAKLEALPSLVDHMLSYGNLRPEDRNPRLDLGPEEYHFLAGLDLHRLPRPIVAICADGSDTYRAWPADRFRALAERASELGGTVLELGMREKLGVGRDYVGELSIRQSAAVLSTCDLFVGNNSGLLHYAQAADVPALAFFSLALPARFVHDDRLVVPVEHTELPCLHCMTKDFVARNRDGCTSRPEAACMRDLPLQSGIAALESIFEEYLSDCPRRGSEGFRARAYRARNYAELAASFLKHGHEERAMRFLDFARGRLAPLARAGS